jgi:photosystem II stability/assembly factor-like uncharacterized protein
MPTTVLVGTKMGAWILRSDETRSQWQTSGPQLKGWLVTAFARSASGRTYAGVTHDVWGATVMASDDLESWEQLESAPRYDASEVGNPGHNRVIGSSDPMEQFTAGGRHVDQIWKLTTAGDVLYAGVFRSADQGKSWQLLRGLNEHEARSEWGPGFGGLCAHSLLVDPTDPERIWVGISAAGVFRSDDGGETFVTKNDGVSPGGDGFCVHSLAQDPRRADVIYRQDHRGVYRTDDGGDSWQCIESGLPGGTLSDGHSCSFGFPVAFDPASESAYVIPLEADSYRYPHDGRLTVYRTRDAGAHWQGFARGLPTSCYTSILRGALAVDHSEPCGVFFGTGNGGVYGSVNGGESWTELSAGLPKTMCVEAFTD